MKWKDEYSTGHDEIDRQHKTLFDFTDEFRLVLNEGCSMDTYSGALEFIRIYSDTHFGFEEKCMNAHNCPFAGLNREEHSNFRSVLENKSEEFEANGFILRDAFSLLDFIDSWLESHICRVDSKLKDYIHEL
jgi:hemerythrin